MNGGGFGGVAAFDGMMARNGVIPSMHVSPQAAHQNLCERFETFPRDVHMYEQQANRIRDAIQFMASQAEYMRSSYQDLLSEKQHLDQLYEQADEKLKKVDRIISRFCFVKDPVVASDGFTYERENIISYMNTCKQSGETPKSKENNENLTSLLVPNRSLRTFLDRLQEIHKTDRSAMEASAPNYAKASAANPGAPLVLSGALGADFAPRAADPVPPAEPTPVPQKDSNGQVIELNARGQRVHPCVRVYGYCNYKDTCAYAKYPYDACLSNLKGKCRFRNQCHERHVEFRGPLNNMGEPLILQQDSPSNGTAQKEKQSE